MKRRSPTLSSAYAYYRLAAKARRGGRHGEADHYTRVADRKIADHRRHREAMAKFKKGGTTT